MKDYGLKYRQLTFKDVLEGEIYEHQEAIKYHKEKIEKLKLKLSHYQLAI